MRRAGDENVYSKPVVVGATVAHGECCEKPLRLFIRQICTKTDDAACDDERGGFMHDAEVKDVVHYYRLTALRTSRQRVLLAYLT